MAEGLSLGKIIALLLGVMALFVILSIIFVNLGILKPTFLNIFGDENKVLKVKDGNTGSEGSFPFYESITEAYNACKLLPEINCYCTLPYTGTPEGYVVEFENLRESTSINLIAGVKVDYSTYNPTKLTQGASLTNLEGVKNTAKKEKRIEEDNLKLRDALISFQTKNKLNSEDFIQAERIYLSKNNLYSTKDVSGKDNIDIKSGIALYKFNKKDTAITSVSDIKELKRCTNIEGLETAEKEFQRLNTILNPCITNKEERCKYVVVPLPEGFTIALINKKIELKYKENTLKSSQEVSQELCLFKDTTNLDLTRAKKLQTLNFKEYLEVDFYAFKEKNKLCAVTYTPEEAKAKKITEQRAEIQGNELQV